MSDRKNVFDESGSSPPSPGPVGRRQSGVKLTSGRDDDLVQKLESSCGERVLFRVNEVAKMLALGRSKVYEMAKTGQVPVLKIGTAVRIPCNALLAWIRRNTSTAA